MRKLSFYSIEDLGGCDKSAHLFLTWGWSQVHNPDLADVIIFNGGADIGAELYGEKSVGYGVPTVASQRDLVERDLYHKYKGHKYFIGICRGAQFLNVMNGGRLWQDVDHHHSDHMMMDITSGLGIRVTSVHHQMMRPNLETGMIIGISSESRFRIAYDDEEIRDPKKALEVAQGQTFREMQEALLKADIEVVWYPDSKSLCIQGHPEYVPNSDFADWSKALVYTTMAGIDPFKISNTPLDDIDVNGVTDPVGA